MASKEFNTIFNKLVQDENDIAGYIAYGIYKRQKMDQIKALTEALGRHPTDEDLASFKKLAADENQLAFYRRSALEISRTFLDESLANRAQKMDETLENRERELKEDFNEEVIKRVSHIRGRFLYGALQSMIGSVFFIILIGAAIFTIYSARLGIERAVEEFFDLEIIHLDCSNPSERDQD